MTAELLPIVFVIALLVVLPLRLLCPCGKTRQAEAPQMTRSGYSRDELIRMGEDLGMRPSDYASFDEFEQAVLDELDFLEDTDY